MPNIQGGKKYKSRRPQASGPTFLPPLESDQMYGYVLKNMGNGRMEVKCYDGKTRVCLICGSMRRRVYVEPSNFVKISVRGFVKYKDGEVEKGDIIMKVLADQEKLLGKIPEYKFFMDSCKELATGEKTNDGIEFFAGGDAGSIDSNELETTAAPPTDDIDIDAI